MHDNSLAKIFGKNLYKKRTELGLTQEELAEKLGIAKQSLSRMERGVMSPKFDRLEDIASQLNCTVTELFSNNNNKNEIESLILDLLNEFSVSEKTIILKIIYDIKLLMKNNQ